jgi:FkbM family methyltransferase
MPFAEMLEVIHIHSRSFPLQRATRGSHLQFHPLRTGMAIRRELTAARHLTANSRSLLQFAMDILLFRALRIGDLPGMDRERRILLRDGIELTYRLNRGDIQSIREIWIDRAYRLPFDFAPRVMIDLGANIGLTSLFLARRHRASTIIAVEPVPDNVRLAKENLERNGVTAEVIEAAVGPHDGRARFEVNRNSNMGRLGDGDLAVNVVSMPLLLAKTPNGRADLVKLDIEGGEQDLLNDGPDWLQSIGALIAEFHPTHVDYPGLVATLRNAGFRHVPAGSAWEGSMDFFVRDGWTADGV